MNKLKDCPFCGEQPEINVLGSCIDIDCCCSMSFQKSDYLSMEQRESWSEKTFSYDDGSESIALLNALEQWNERANDE